MLCDVSFCYDNIIYVLILYYRYTQPPGDLWDWYESFLDDEEVTFIFIYKLIDLHSVDRRLKPSRRF